MISPRTSGKVFAKTRASLTRRSERRRPRFHFATQRTR